LAYFDVGEQLKFVARVTGKWGSIIYIGYSMGSTLAFLYGSGYPIEANSLLSGIIALAPVLYFKDVPVVDQLVEISGPLEVNRANTF
jgi:lysosomal acid lipase/cholesteryl ester hydrolase